MAQFLRTGLPPRTPVPAARARFQPLAAGDLARCVVQALKDPGSIRRTCGGQEHLTCGQMLDIWLADRNQRRVKLPVPLPLTRLGVPVMEQLLADPPVTSVELKQLEVKNCSTTLWIRTRWKIF